MTTRTTLPAGHMLMWYDDSKRPAAIKLRDACAAYEARFGERPGVALVHEAETCEAVGIEVRASAGVRPGNMWLGRAE